MKRQIPTIVAFLTLFAIIISVTAVQGTMLGVGPSYIIIKDALRGAAPYEKTLYIYNEDNENHTISLKGTENVSGWVTFYEFNDLNVSINSTFVQNNTMKTILCKIFIPEDTANGLYNGTIEASVKANKVNESSENTSQVELVIPILVSINVTGLQDFNLTVQNVNIENTEINFLSKISVEFKNSGNVRASPVVEVIITKDGRYIDEISSAHYSFPDILPEKMNTYIMDWNTTGKVSGSYIANFTITNSNDVIYQEDVEFSLFPPGTFTRNGTLKSITYQGDLKKGAELKIISTFLNTGEVDTYAKFLGEVYRDGQLVSTLNSEEIIVRKFTEKSFVSYITLAEDGKYQVMGHFLYEGKETNTRELDFTIGSALNSIYLIIIFGAVVCGVAGGSLYIRRNKRNKKTEPDREEIVTAPISRRKAKVETKKKSKKRIKFNRTPQNIESRRKQEK